MPPTLGGCDRRRGQGGEPDPAAPVLSSFRRPVARHVAGSACDDIEEPVTVQVDDLGGGDGVVIGRGVEEPFVVDSDRGPPSNRTCSNEWSGGRLTAFGLDRYGFLGSSEAIDGHRNPGIWSEDREHDVVSGS